MPKLTDIGSSLEFDEKEHIYKDKNGNILTSVTQFLGLFKEPFDPTGIIAYKCAQREGITKREIQERWAKTNRDACDLGHRIHGKIEKFLKTGEISNDQDKDIVEEFSKIKFKGTIFSELRLKSDKYSLAGTCDIATLNKEMVKISDIKTNKTFLCKSKYNKKLLYPINHLSDSHLNIYSLQILIYGELVKEHGWRFSPGQILWINPETRKIERYDVEDLEKEALMILDFYDF